MTNKLINRNTKTTTFSLPPEMAEQVQDVMREEGRTMSDLVREALRLYMEEREWRQSIRYERLHARRATEAVATGGNPDAYPTGPQPGGPPCPGIQRPAGRGPLRGLPAAGAAEL